MKYTLAVCLIIITGLAFAETNTVPEFRTSQVRRVDGGGAKRVTIYVTVGAGLSTNQVRSVIETVVMYHFDEHAISVAVSEHGCAPSGYTVAQGVWAPGGEWKRAREGRSDPHRETYELTTSYRDSYFDRDGVPKWPAKVGLTWEEVCRMCGELQTACMKATDEVFKKFPLGNEEARKKAKDAAIAEVAARYNLSPRVARQAWMKWREEVY